MELGLQMFNCSERKGHLKRFGSSCTAKTSEVCEGEVADYCPGGRRGVCNPDLLK